MLMFGSLTGLLLAIMLDNAGGAWDNAKKYIESGQHGGKVRIPPLPPPPHEHPPSCCMRVCAHCVH
jgi:hypothetical protein